jgi:hypothetical protein
MHPMFVRLFIETGTDDLLAEEQDRKLRARCQAGQISPGHEGPRRQPRPPAPPLRHEPTRGSSRIAGPGHRQIPGLRAGQAKRRGGGGRAGTVRLLRRAERRTQILDAAARAFRPLRVRRDQPGPPRRPGSRT